MRKRFWFEEGIESAFGHLPEIVMPTWNAYAAACPTRLVLDRIADKWAVLLLGLLARGPLRFNRLRREVEGISQKYLSQSLKGLERDGLVSRKATPPCR